MKNYCSIILVALILLCFPLSSFGQGEPSDPENLRQVSYLQKQMVIPTTPEAASLGKYGDVDVNLYTGALGYGIPIYSLQGKKIGMPISLSYDGSGNKVQALPTWVGLGWTLQAGGVITRVVQADPDEKANYYDRQSDLTATWQGNSNLIATNDLYEDVTTGGLETQPDVYYYNFNGNSGKFYLKPGAFANPTNQDNIVQKESKDVEIVPTFETDGDIQKFTLKDAMGNTYYFETVEYTKYQYDDEVTDPARYKSLYYYNSAWYLTKIVSAVSNEEIVFDYHTLTTPYQAPTNPNYYQSLTFAINEPEPCVGQYPCGSTTVGVLSTGGENDIEVYNRRYLKSATYKLSGKTLEKVEFSVSNNTAPYGSDSKKLDSITVKKGPYLNRFSNYKFTYDGSTNRLTLKEFQEFGVDNQTSKPPYLFTYNDNSDLPAPTSSSVDHWGYFNNNSSSGSLIPTVPYCNGSTIEYINPSGADRKPVESKMKAGVLKKVEYPTGGYSEFEFEAHRVKGKVTSCNSNPPDRIGGGLRIKEIRHYANTGVLSHKKTYNYVLEGSTYSSGIYLVEPDYMRESSFHHEGISQQGSGCDVEATTYTCQKRTISANSRTPLGAVQGSHVGYSRVEEVNIGKVVHHFENEPLAPEEFDELENGQLLKTEVFDLAGKLVQKTEYEYVTYAEDQRRSNSFIGFRVQAKPAQSNQTLLCETSGVGQWILPISSCSGGSSKVFNSKFEAKTYSLRQRWYYLKKKTDTQKFYVNGSTPAGGVVSVTDFVYGNENVSQPTNTKVVNSDGKLHEQIVSYPSSSVESSLFNSHMLSYPVTSERKVDGTLQYFTQIDYHNATKVPEDYSEKFTSTALLQRETFDVYDGNKNIRQATRINDQPSSFLWSNYNQFVGAKIQNANIKEVAFTSFETRELAQGNWSLSASDTTELIYDNDLKTDARTGHGYFSGSGSISKPNYSKTPAGTYILSYYKRGSGSVNISPSNGNITTSTTDAQGWVYVTHKISLPDSMAITVNISSLDIDELRLYPADALMTTYSYDQNTNQLISITGPNGVHSSFVYDDLHRLQLTRDMDQNILEGHLYEYESGLNTVRNLIKSYQVLKEGVVQVYYGTKGGGNAAPGEWLLGLNNDQVNKTYQYIDGLGRALQNIGVKQSPSQYDMITPVAYDTYGRSPKAYLHYTNSAATNGTYRSSAITEQASFYTSLGGYGYISTEFDDSPLNRVEEQRDAGNSPPKKMFYGTNGVNEVRKFWTSGYYAANTLIKVTAEDENNHETITYTDKLGRKIMTSNEGLKTYYVYDDFGAIKAVVPPKAAKKGHQYSSWTYTQSSLLPQCYIYGYDAEHRMITKRMPGSGQQMAYAYDKLDRLILATDQNGVKIFTKYDILGRPVITGKYNGSGTPTGSEPLFEMPNTSGPHYYTSSAFPTSNFDVYTVTYYDDHDINNSGGVLDTDENHQVPYSGYPTPVHRSRGMITVTKTAILASDGSAPDTSDYLFTRSYYDIKGRIVQIKADNHLGQTDVTYNKYLFPGWIDKTRTEQSVDLSGNTITTNINKRYEYDHSGRLLKVFQKIDGESTETEISAQSYDERDQLVQKKLHNTGSNYLQTVDYSYNIRGWLTQINDIGNTADMFALKLHYGNGDTNLSSEYSTESYWNGNITMMDWQIGGTGNISTYGFLYDAHDRVENSIFAYKTGSTYDNNDRYNTSVYYDEIGNITRMDRRGEWGSAGSGFHITVDNMYYTYNTHGQLSSLNEYGSTSYGFATGNANSSYTYDNNGNMISDGHKGISSIAYNYMNLPRKITFSNGDVLDCVYDAAGNKLSKIPNSGAPTHYVAGIEYNATGINAIYHEEGFLEPNGTNNYKYYYYLRDHLGNNRVIFQDANGNGSIAASEITQQRHYYPFGMNMKGAWTASPTMDDYQYNGKELNEEFSLNWNSYGAREYDASIGRFMTIDRFAEKYTSMNPYQYGANNPIKFIDVNGDSIDVSAIYNLKDKSIINTLTSDLSKITGLNISVSNGFLTYEENESSDGSSTASDYLKSLIDGKETVEVIVSGVSRTKENKVELGLPAIENHVKNTPDELNEKTLGWGMTLIHELKHTGAGGGLKDPIDKTDFSSTGNVVDFVNVVRGELDARSGNSKPYGTRQHYFYKPTDTGIRRLNFSYNTVNNNGKVRRKYASFILK